MTDLQAFLQYLLTIELLGLAVWPLARKLFRKFPDQGWGFSKVTGLLLVSYLAWLTGILRVAPFTLATLLVVAVVVAATSFTFLPFKNLKYLKKPNKHKARENTLPWKLILFEELLFISSFAFWSYLRTFSPNIHGLEKYMDYGFMLSILRADYFPPLDHFLAGESINYYYFGHLMAAVLTRLSQVPSEIAYNLQMNLLFALTVLESFVLGSTLYSKVSKPNGFRINPVGFITAGLLASFFVTLAGNLHTIFYWPIEGAQYWYPDATRFIENTIHEFPIYSFVVNDLHGHVADLPVVLLIIGLLLVYFVSKTEGKEGREGIGEKGILVFLALTIGTTYATNAWDFMIYLVLAGLVFLLAEALSRPLGSRIIPVVAVRSVIVAGLAVLSMLPYWLTVKPIGKGIGIVPLGAQSPPWQWLVLWGHFAAMTLVFAVWLFKKGKKEEKEVEGQKRRAFLERITFNVLRVTPTDAFVLTMMLWSLVLVLLPEIIFVRDIYPTHYRANTMFKFGYQAFIMFGISLSYVIMRLWTQLRGLPQYLFRALTVLMIFSVALYPLKAIESGFNGLRAGTRKSLDGTAYLETLRPSDAAAIDWINTNIDGQPVFVEAVGESYTDYARIAANTGIPTVMGWPVHEWLWRGSYGEPMLPTTQLQLTTGEPDTVGQRVADMQTLYETTDANVVTNLINKYSIDYIYVGELEREKYKNLSGDKFSQLGQIAYSSDSVTIYRVNDKLSSQ